MTLKRLNAGRTCAEQEGSNCGVGCSTDNEGGHRQTEEQRLTESNVFVCYLLTYILTYTLTYSMEQSPS